MSNFRVYPEYEGFLSDCLEVVTKDHLSGHIVKKERTNASGRVVEVTYVNNAARSSNHCGTCGRWDWMGRKCWLDESLQECKNSHNWIPA